MQQIAQREYKTRHDWVGKVIHWELYKKYKFDQTNKWYMHNLTSLLENETHNIFWDLAKQVNLLISARWLDNKKKKKKKKKKEKEKSETCRIVEFAVQVDQRIKLKAQRKISTWTLLENGKNYGSWE